MGLWVRSSLVDCNWVGLWVGVMGGRGYTKWGRSGLV